MPAGEATLSSAQEAADITAAFAACEHLARTHYENFSLGTRMLPKRLRCHFYSVYAFCRGVDDLGDEAAGDRLKLLDEWERLLRLCYSGKPDHPYFLALRETIRRFDIPVAPFLKLIEANRRDQAVTRYADYAELLDYCDHSANPVGHLVLYVFGHRDTELRALADETCTALQLTNFWQDVARDYAGGRVYIPREDLERFGVGEDVIASGVAGDGFRRLMRFEVERAREMFRRGLPLIDKVVKPARVDVALFTAGGLAVLRAIERQDYDVLSRRPALSRWSKARLLAAAMFRRRLGLSPLPRGGADRAGTRMHTPDAKSNAAVVAVQVDGGAAVEAAYRTCRARTKQSASSFYYAFLLLPRHKRSAIYATYAFCRLCDDIVDEPVGDGSKPAERLHEVRVGLDRAYEGRPGGDMWLALNDASARFGVRRRHFRDIIDGVEMDLERSRYETFEDLRRYCHRVASAVGLVCIEICGYRDERAVDHAVDLGIAMQLTNILRDVKEDAQRGRVYIPLEDLRRFGCTERELIDGRVNDAFRSLMAFEVARARRYFESGSRLFPLLDRRSRACTSGMHAVYSRLLDRIERAGYDVFNSRVGVSNPVKLALVAGQWVRSLLPSLR